MSILTAPHPVENCYMDDAHFLIYEHRTCVQATCKCVRCGPSKQQKVFNRKKLGCKFVCCFGTSLTVLGCVHIIQLFKLRILALLLL